MYKNVLPRSLVVMILGLHPSDPGSNPGEETKNGQLDALWGTWDSANSTLSGTVGLQHLTQNLRLINLTHALDPLTPRTLSLLV